MSELTPSQLNPRLLEPVRGVKRSGRISDHEDDGRPKVVGLDHEEKRHGHADDEPAVVVSHPTANVTVGESLEGTVIELTPRNQPVLETSRLRLLIEAELPLPLQTKLRLTFVEVTPVAMARIDMLNGEAVPDAPTVQVMVLALAPGEGHHAPAPTSYAPNSAAARAKIAMRNDNG